MLNGYILFNFRVWERLFSVSLLCGPPSGKVLQVCTSVCVYMCDVCLCVMMSSHSSHRQGCCGHTFQSSEGESGRGLTVFPSV